jgi:protein involved in polysaccharide export with SLBB domain/capsular polysaccharide biosynthesis protein
MDSTSYNSAGNGGVSGSSGAPERPTAGAVDGWTVIEVLRRRWFWILFCGLLLGGAGGFTGWYLWKPGFSATTQLIRVESEHLTEFFKPRAFTEQTFGSLLRTPELMARVGSQMSPPLSANEVNALLQITPIPESDIVTVTAHGDTPEFVVYLANLYATNAVLFTRELQKREAGAVNEALKTQLAQMDSDISKLEEQLQKAPKVPFQPNQQLTGLYERLQLAQTELTVLRGRFHDIHPDVQRKLAEIEEIQKQIKTMNPENAAPGIRRELQTADSMSQTNADGTRRPARVTTDAWDPSHEYLRNQLYALAAARLTLAARQRDSETFLNNPPGYSNVLTPANPQEVAVDDPRTKIAFLGLLGFAVGVGAALALVLLIELLDDRLRTVDDLRRVTRLPVLATLGDLRRIPPTTQANWAFRTWTALQYRLSPSANHGLVCGITSSAPREGRSTWVHLLSQAASQCGFKVMTIATLPSSAHAGNGKAEEAAAEEVANDEEPISNDEPTRAEDGEDEIHYSSAPAAKASGVMQDVPPVKTMSITKSVLASPDKVAQQIEGDPHPLVHIPLPGWVWNLERRKDWQTALAQWSRIDNIVILVELPPANSSEAILLAENLPNLIWLADSGRSSAADCREQLQTLRNARCNLVGSVLNHEPKPPLKKRFSRWMGCWLALAALASFAAPADGQVQPVPTQPAVPPATAPVPAVAPPPTAVDVEDTAPRTNVSFSVTAPNQRAPWQQRLTLGPGDVLNFNLFGQADLGRTEVVIGPDGGVSYLQASVNASGLTIDELRVRVDEGLGKYYRSPRTVITPVTWRSKKYYVLGKVVNKGVYTLDRPITILEAVARAQGLETGLLDQNSVDLADLQRSFLMRRGQKAPVNFEKLFYQGDLSQNIPIEPDDYLYFAAGNLKEVYVVGEVNQPGPVLHTPSTTLVGAIAGRSGFTDRAYKSKVLVVRGSLTHPNLYVVDVWKGLEGRALDFKLEPKDIIYVSHRPFIRGEELLDLAITGFIQAATAAWVGEHVGPLIKRPILK